MNIYESIPGHVIFNKIACPQELDPSCYILNLMPTERELLVALGCLTCSLMITSSSLMASYVFSHQEPISTPHDSKYSIILSTCWSRLRYPCLFTHVLAYYTFFIIQNGLNSEIIWFQWFHSPTQFKRRVNMGTSSVNMGKICYADDLVSCGDE